MKTLLRCATLLCMSLSLGTSTIFLPREIANAEPSVTPPTVQTPPSLLGTWTAPQEKLKAILIFNDAGEINFFEEKIYGDYKYYKLTPDYFLMNQLSNDSLKLEAWPKYQVQGNKLTVTSVNGPEDLRRLEFSADGQSVTFIKEDNTSSNFTVKRVNNNTQPPANTETKETVQGHFHGLKKLVAIQTAQTQYWQKKRRFATKIQNLSLKSYPESDKLYEFKIIQINQRESTIAAIAKQPNLHSYVLRVDRIGRRQQLFDGLLCGTDRPSNEKPPVPQIQDKKLTCQTKTHRIDLPFSITRSLAQAQ
jgi:Type IV pilin-like G and H, putative